MPGMRKGEDGRGMSKDGLVALCWGILGILISIGSFKVGILYFNAPGAGLFPLLIGLATIFLSAILFLTSFRKKDESGNGIVGVGVRKKNLLLVLGALIVYALVIEILGFPITTFIFMVLVMRGVEPQRWTTILFIAVLSTLFTYLLFSVWLKVELPKGILGI